MYIDPIIKIHSTFDEAKEFYNQYGNNGLLSEFMFGEDSIITVEDLSKGNRNLVVGEPGVGKTELLNRIKDHLNKNKFSTALISLRNSSSLEDIDKFIGTKSEIPKVLLLDALDEVKSNTFPDVLEKIEKISSLYPDLQIYISARWVFIRRYSTFFSRFRFITISPFTKIQVRKYLLQAGQSDEDINALLDRIMPFGHNNIVVQIPRYLFYLNAFIKQKGIKSVTEISRNELFEYFIYSKLEGETKLTTEKRLITKRVLEKLALAMEIYQTNFITQDELMTFFDELKSDLKLAALSQIDLQIFYDNSLLKVSIEGLGKIEFDNTEFQEYLAAKEITRFADPRRAAFAFAVDLEAKSIFPTWFNTLTFLVDMQPDILGQLVEFADIRGTIFKPVDEGFLSFLSKLNPNNFSIELRRVLFKDLLAYHQRTLQWLTGELTASLPGFFDSTIEEELKEWILKAEAEVGARRFVLLGNVVYIVAYLLKSKVALDKVYWRNKLISFVSDENDNGVLQRHALLALSEFEDPTTINDVPNLLDKEELISREFISFCARVDPDHPKSLEYFFEATRRDDLHGRFGLFAITKHQSIKRFLEVFNNDDSFRQEFLDDTSIFKERDSILAVHIDKIFDEEIKELCKQAIVKSTDFHFSRNVGSSSFILGIWRILKEKDDGFIVDIIDRIYGSKQGRSGLYFTVGLFSSLIEKEDVKSFLEKMISINERDVAFSVMLKIKFSDRKLANEIFEEGRVFLPDQYSAWENSPPVEEPFNYKKEIFDEFKILLGTKSEEFNYGLFEFYIQNKNELEPLSDENKSRLDFLTKKALEFDPGKSVLNTTHNADGSSTFTTDRRVFLFGDALNVASQIGLDVSSFKQNVINFIPFAFDEQLEVVFSLVKEIKADEIKNVIQVYSSHSSDLWYHRPLNFIDIVEKFHIVNSVTILKSFVTEEKLDRYARERSLIVASSLIYDKDFLYTIFNLYKDSSNGNEKYLANIANGLLISSGGDASAVKWRLSQIIEKAQAFVQPRGVHSVDELENELLHKTFAKPLMDCNAPGFENDYFGLLDQAVDIWGRGSQFHKYAGYIWDIVFSYFDNLKIGRTYKPLQLLEKKISNIKDKEGVNWLALRLMHLRRSYLSFVGKPQNISEAIIIYNNAISYNNKKILNSDDLFNQLVDILENDLKTWIEGEGAYDFIVGEKIFDKKKQGYEDLVQKTLKTQVGYMLLKRGFEANIGREEQLYDGKRVDFLVRYGFAGPVVVEVKLTTNTDIKCVDIGNSPSYLSMKRYMDGYGASHGIFLVIDNAGASNLAQIKEVFETIPNVVVKSFVCTNLNKVQKKSKNK